MTTSIREELKEKIEKFAREPKDVLRDMMLFYDEKARDILESIITALEDTDENGKPTKRGDLLALMYKKHSEAADKAIECASKLAPYRHPKLESIETKTEITKRFVVRAPVVLPTTEQWLRQVPQITHEQQRLEEISLETKVDELLIDHDTEDDYFER